MTALTEAQRREIEELLTQDWENMSKSELVNVIKDLLASDTANQLVLKRLKIHSAALEHHITRTDGDIQRVEKEFAQSREEARRLREALDSIKQYADDTLSGRIDGPDDRDWQREGIVEISNRAIAALSQSPPATEGK